MPSARLSIDSTATPQPYDRMIFGLFIEHFHRQVYGGIFDTNNRLSDAQGFRTDVIAALRELHVPIVRWPGGCFVSAYHWLNGVGKNRTPMWDKAWHVEDSNNFGTDEFIAWCRKIGAEPYICTNAGTGIAEEMSDWVEYCNLSTQGRFAQMRIANGHLDPYNVKYWSVGNENWGGHEMGAKNIKEWRYFVRESAKLMNNVDPTLQLSAAATPDPRWTLPLLQTAGSHLNLISIHGYWDPLWQKDTPADYLTCMLKTQEPEHQIKQIIHLLKKAHCADRIQIAFDEWNLRGWHHPGFGMRYSSEKIQARDRNDINATYTMADALFSACFLNSCLRYSKYVKMACLAPGVNTRGPLYVHPHGIVKRSTFYVLKMYATGLQPFVVPSQLKSPKLRKKGRSVPVVDAIVTSTADRKQFTLIFVNKSPDSAIDVYIGIPNLPTEVETEILVGDSVDAFNDISQENRIIAQKCKIPIKKGAITLPPHALVQVILR